MPEDKTCIQYVLPTLATRLRIPTTLGEPRGHEPTSILGLLQHFEETRWILNVLVFDIELSVGTSEEGEDSLTRQATITHLVASVELAEGLLQDWHPRLLRVPPARIQDPAILVNGHPIVNNNVRPLTVQVEPHAIDPNRYIVLDNDFLEALWLAAGDRAHRAEEEARAKLTLDYVTSARSIFVEHRLTDYFTQAFHARWLRCSAVPTRLFLVDVDALLRPRGQVKLRICVLASLLPAPRYDISNLLGAHFPVCRLPG
mmetsp:Transcript_66126/g.175221  ORF Transcript_66126/g.175221 Transcript_66126/m.175221 type:complete len:258 (-) Transcript_66126:878-1651(-)